MTQQAPPADSLETEIRHLRLVVTVVVVVAVVGLVVLGNTDIGDGLSLAYPVALVGAGAATANNVRRLHRVRGIGEEAVVEIDDRLVIAQIYLSPVVGATFAVLLYGLFMSGILRGGLFPEFPCASDPFSSFGDFSTCPPGSNGDAAKAMVWAFVAGFSERFVPNIIDRIGKAGAAENG